MSVEFEEGTMHMKGFKSLLILAGTILILVLAFAPSALAGGCDDDEEDCGGGGGSDSGAAAGGVETGFGGMASADGTKILLPMSLAGGGVVLLSVAGGLALARRRNDE
jgi:hypothetical protein